jgi:hypothetical protein
MTKEPIKLRSGTLNGKDYTSLRQRNGVKETTMIRKGHSEVGPGKMKLTKSKKAGSKVSKYHVHTDYDEPKNTVTQNISGKKMKRGSKIASRAYRASDL